MSSNVIPFPVKTSTPISDKIYARARKLALLSNYPCEFDFDTYRRLETRFGVNQPRGGIIFQTPFNQTSAKLIDSHGMCRRCFHEFEIDTYGRGCIHNCVYCYPRTELALHGYWNRPFPMPIDITEVWKIFYYALETDKESKWRNIIKMRVPLRIGSISDSFMLIDKKHKVTQELLRILAYYDYPYIIFTRSDLIAHDEYLELLRPELCSVQMSIASTNDELNRKIEPSAPNAKRRLSALQKLTRNGFWTTARLNPFFPMYPDGYFTDPNFDRRNMPAPFHYSSFSMVDEIAEHGVPAILAGVVRLSRYAMNCIEKVCGRNLQEFYRQEEQKGRDFHYSDAEIRAYYERLHAKCMQRKVQFTTNY